MMTSQPNADLGSLRRAIAETVAERERLKLAMAAWYDSGKPGRFPEWRALEQADRRLSELDTRFKRAYDASSA